MKCIQFYALLFAVLFTTPSVTYAANPNTNLPASVTQTQKRGLPAAKWNQVAKMTASDGRPFDFFGNSVAVSGDDKTVVVGAPYANEAYVYVKPASGWHNMTQIATLKSSDGRFGFGYSVAMGLNMVM